MSAATTSALELAAHIASNMASAEEELEARRKRFTSVCAPAKPMDGAPASSQLLSLCQIPAASGPTTVAGDREMGSGAGVGA